MKALVLTDIMQLAYLDVPDPEPGPGDVLVRVHACGICGSDIHGMDGSSGRRRPPVVMGHEAAGVVAAVGPGVEGWSPGERVTFDSTVYCGVCPYCRAGRVNLCDRRRVLGVSCADYRCDGAFAEYVVVPARILYRLPPGLSFAEAAMVEALSVAVHAVGRDRPRVGDAVAVIGAGMIGLMVIQVLKNTPCRRIIAVDPDAGRRALALRLGATDAVDPGAGDTAAAIRELTSGEGADSAYEVVGAEGTVAAAVDSLRKGGRLTLVGNLSARVAFPLQAAVTREISIHGSCASSGEYPACLDLMATGKVDAGALISAVAPLADGAAYFRRLYDREPGLMKVILTP